MARSTGRPGRSLPTTSAEWNLGPGVGEMLVPTNLERRVLVSIEADFACEYAFSRPHRNLQDLQAVATSEPVRIQMFNKIIQNFRRLLFLISKKKLNFRGGRGESRYLSNQT